jgi:hypothetical protein
LARAGALLQRSCTVQVGECFSGPALGSCGFAIPEGYFLWHIFTTALLDLDRNEGYYNFEDWPADDGLQSEQNLILMMATPPETNPSTVSLGDSDLHMLPECSRLIPEPSESVDSWDHIFEEDFYSPAEPTLFQWVLYWLCLSAHLRPSVPRLKQPLHLQARLAAIQALMLKPGKPY